MNPLQSLYAWVKEHRGAFLIAGGLLLAFATGRFMAPTKVVEKHAEAKTETKAEDTKKAETHAEVKERIVYRDHTVLVHPDGSQEHRDIERTEEGDHKTDSTTAEHAEASGKTEVKTSEKTVERSQPSLHLSALAGIDNHLSQIFGIHAEARVLGPLWLGGWVTGTTAGAAAGGISLGISF